MIVTEEMRQELNQAALATNQAYASCPPLGPGKYLLRCVSAVGNER